METRIKNGVIIIFDATQRTTIVNIAEVPDYRHLSRQATNCP